MNQESEQSISHLPKVISQYGVEPEFKPSSDSGPLLSLILTLDALIFPVMQKARPMRVQVLFLLFINCVSSQGENECVCVCVYVHNRTIQYTVPFPRDADTHLSEIHESAFLTNSESFYWKTSSHGNVWAEAHDLSIEKQKV